jgi:hypothetical protein
MALSASGCVNKSLENKRLHAEKPKRGKHGKNIKE